MTQPCDCCEGPRVLTPLPTENRPGLSQLSYRIGTHATFFETMQTRLSSSDYPEVAALRTRETSDPSIALLDAWATVGDVLTFYQERIANEGYLRTATERRSVLELARLIRYALRPGVAASVYLAYSIDKDAAPVEIPKGARANSVPAPGEQMQSFETADPLTAHVEWNQIKPRSSQPQTKDVIAKNGLYLQGTATNLKTNDPLLVDFGGSGGLRFFHIESVTPDADNKRTNVVLRGLAAAQPASETAASIAARYGAVENFGVSGDAAMTKRVLAVMNAVASAESSGPQALATHLAQAALPALRRELQTARDSHFTRLAPWIEGLTSEFEAIRRRAAADTRAATAAVGPNIDEIAILGGVIDKLKLPPSLPPAGPKQLQRDIVATYGQRADTIPRLLTTLQPSLRDTFYTSWKNLPPPETSNIAVYALRVAAAPFGHNAPLRQTGFDSDNKRAIMGEWEINDPWNIPPQITSSAARSAGGASESATSAPTDYQNPQDLYLDNDYDIAPDSAIVVEKPDEPDKPIIVKSADGLERRSLAAYGLSGKTLKIMLPKGTSWITDADSFSTVRRTRVFAGSEMLDLAEETVNEEVAGSEIELDNLYAGLEPGRWLIIAGERSDIKAGSDVVGGVKAAELVMIAAVEQKLKLLDDGSPLPGDQIHTFVTLAKPLAYRYRRDTVTIYGNVVRATHGETRQEVLGSGDAAAAFQQFALKQPPLTYVSASTLSGVASTLAVRVNDIEWHEADNLSALGPNDRKFITRTNDDARTLVIFGNGEHGARPPTGQENLKAAYRNGIGKPGNVKAGQITLLSTRPLGVKDVINPIRASGGADKEGLDSARRNAPVAVMALDRLVSTQDYADFARTFAGVGKAAAVRLTDGRRQVVQVTIAGSDDIPIETTSDLYRNLYDALHRFGDPYLPVNLAVRDRLALVVSARVRIDPDYQWDALEPKIRAAMLDAFGFSRLELGEDLLLSDAIKMIQGLRGVIYVDVDIFDAISEAALLAGFTAPAAGSLTLKDRIAIEPGRVLSSSPGQPRQLAAAQIAYLAPEVPDTLILQELHP